MKFILVLFCTFTLVISAPPRQTQVKIDVNGSSARRAGVVIHHSGPAERANVQVSHKHEYEGNDGIVGHTNVHITRDVYTRIPERTEIRLSGGGGGASGTQTKIVAYGTGLTLPGHISGNIRLY